MLPYYVQKEQFLNEKEEEPQDSEKDAQGSNDSRSCFHLFGLLVEIFNRAHLSISYAIHNFFKRGIEASVYTVADITA